MSQFSELLQKYIHRTGKTIYLLAKKADVNRPMIHKALKGDSIPGDGFIEQLSDAMMLSVAERLELLNAAERARVGEIVYHRRKMIEGFLTKDETREGEFIFNPASGYVSALCSEDREYKMISSHYELCCCLWEMLNKRQKEKMSSAVYFKLPETAEDLLSILYHFQQPGGGYYVPALSLCGHGEGLSQ